MKATLDYQTDIFVFGLRRSGNHALIFKIIDDLPCVVHHFNNCLLKPNNEIVVPEGNTFIFDKDKDPSLPSMNLFSFEDVDLKRAAQMQLPETVYVLVRSPQNMFASRIVRCRRHPDCHHEYGCRVTWDIIDRQKQYMREVLGETQFLPTAHHLVYDQMIEDTPERVAESCYGSSEQNRWHLDKSKLSERWRQFECDPEFLSCFDAEMGELASKMGFPLPFSINADAVFARKLREAKEFWNHNANHNKLWTIETRFREWFSIEEHLWFDYKHNHYDWLECSVLASLRLIHATNGKALDMALRALELRRNAHNINLLMLVLSRGDVRKAAEVIDREFSGDPQWPVLMARVATWFRDFEQAEKLARTALNCPMHHRNLATYLMAQGKWSEGFEHYEYRKQADKPLRDAIEAIGHEWNGVDDLNDKQVLVYFEQGAGDGIMGSRWIADLVKKYPDIKPIINADESTKPLFDGLPFISKTDWASGERYDYDYMIPLLSLPHLLQLEVSGKPYITYDGVNDQGKGKIGLCWLGNPLNQSDKIRSIPLSVFTCLDLPWISLQYGYEGDEIEQTDIKDFGDTAALVNAVECVVTCDTAVAHLAGAMGKRTILCLPYRGEWRWGTKESCDLYDSVSIIRCDEFGGWETIIKKLADKLVVK